MGPNKQRKQKSEGSSSRGGGSRGGRGGGGRGGGRGRGGGAHHHSHPNLPKGVGMHEAHKNMLVDVLRNVATGGKTGVSDAHFDHLKNTIVFQRNRALTRLEIAQVVFERMGFPSSVVTAYIGAATASARAEAGIEASSPGSEDPQAVMEVESSWLPEYKTAQELQMNDVFLDSVAHDLFLTLVNTERDSDDVAAAANEAPPDEAEREMNEAMRNDEWETIQAMFDDVFVVDEEDNGAAADDGEDDDDDFDDEDDYDDKELRVATQDGTDVRVWLRLFGDYPRQPPSMLIPASAALTPSARNGILTSVASCIAAHAGVPCLMPVLSGIQSAVGEALSIAAEEKVRAAAEAKKKAVAAAQAKEMKMDASTAEGSRQQFLESLVVQDKQQRPDKKKELEVKNTALSSDGKRNSRQPAANVTHTASGQKIKRPSKTDPVAKPQPQPEAEAAGSPAKAAEAQPMLPEVVKPKAVDAASLTREFVRTTFAKRDLKVDQRMYDQWAKLKAGGSLKHIRDNLPAYQLRGQLKQALEKSRVVVVGGDTGSGKTTQVPQFVLEYFAEDRKGSLCNIVCTQPRRLAATAVALRVADERDESIGGTVGYSIRLESRIGPDTRLLYCTTGILLRRMQADSTIGNISHVIVDEVHERGVDTDFLMILLRDLLRRRSDLTVILMSATMNATKFSDYFGGAPVLSIPGRTHPVTIHHLERIIPTISYVLEEGSRYSMMDGVGAKVKQMRNARHTSDIAMARAEYDDDERGGDGAARKAAKLAQGSSTEPIDPQTASTLARMDPDRINYELIDKLVDHIDRTNPRCDGAILIFMPGMAEINMCCEELRGNPHLSRRCVIFNLHSSLGNVDQKAVFGKPPKGRRKVVVGTNIMETSITIDDAVYVIDCGKFKENRYDPRKSLSQLVTCWVSKAAARQRMGRAGRVRPGQCYRLYSTGHFERLEDSQLCEMQRVPLESLILQIHVLNLGDEMVFLRKAMDPPVERAVQGSVAVLTDLGALSREARQLTSLGYHLANLPLDVRIGKMIIIGAVLRCLDPVLTVAACVSVRSPFQTASDDAPQIDQIRRAFSREYNSDLLAMYFAYAKWLQEVEQGGVARGRAFCREAFLSTTALAQIQSTKQQYERYLVEAGFIDVKRTAAGVPEAQLQQKRRGAGGARFMSSHYVTLENTVYETGGRHYNENSTVIKCVVASLVAGLYPNVAKLAPKPTGPPPPGAPAGRVPFVKASSRDGTDVAIHPSSVNAARQKEFTYPFICYVEKVKTSAIFLRDTSMVSPYALVLFGGPSIYLAEYAELVFDNWVSFACAEEDAVLLMRLKEQLESAMMAKINDPALEWESTAGNVVRAMERLLKDEGTRSLVVVTKRARAARYVDPNTGAEGGVGAGGKRMPKATKQQKRVDGRRRLAQCFNCGEKGHLARECTNKPLGIGPTEPCFVCGARAHYPTECPVLKRPAKAKAPDAAAAADDDDDDDRE